MNKYELDVKKLIDLFYQNQFVDTKVNGGEVILIVGPTGCGKSTTANYLLGSEMYQRKIIKQQDLDGENFVYEEEVIDSKGPFQIGHSTQSQTPTLQIVNLQNDLFVCDTPGFFDNRGVEIEIANTFSLKKFILNCQSVRIVVLISYHEIKAQRGLLFQNVFEIVSNILKKHEKQSFEKIAFLFTLVPKDKSVNSLKKEVIEFYRNLKSGDTIMKEFLKVVLNQLESNQQIIITPTDRKHENILQIILDQTPFTNPQEEICFKITEKSNQMLEQFVKEIKNSIFEQQQKGEYRSILEQMIILKQLRECLNEEQLTKQFFEIQTQIVSNFQQQKNKAIQIFKKDSKKNNSFCSQHISEIQKVIENLQIIEEYKDSVFEKYEFQLSVELFKQEIINICKKILQKIDRDFPEDFESVKVNLKKLKDISNETSFTQSICDLIQEDFIKKYHYEKQKFEEIIKQSYIRPSLLDIESIQKNISIIIKNLDLFTQVDQFLSDQIPGINQENTCQQTIQLLKFNNEQILETLKKMILDIQEQIQLLQDDPHTSINLSLAKIPDFEIYMLKFQSQNLKYIEYISGCDKNYNEAIQYLNYFIIKQISDLQLDLWKDMKQSKFENIIKMLIRIISIDDIKYGFTFEKYYQMKDKIQQKIKKQAKQAKNTLTFYHKEMNEYEFNQKKIDEQRKKNFLNKQINDFQKLTEDFNLIQSFKWLDEAFDVKLIQNIIENLKKDIQSYSEFCNLKIKGLLDRDDFIDLSFYLLKLKNISTLISKVQNISIQQSEILDEVREKMFEINKEIDEFLQNNQIDSFNKNQWRELSNYIVYLKRNQILLIADKLKNDSIILLDKIKTFIRTYFEDNFKYIESLPKNTDIQEANCRQFSQCINDAKLIQVEYEEIQSFLSEFSFQNLENLVRKVYNQMVFDYIQKKEQLEDFIEIQARYQQLNTFVQCFIQFDYFIRDFRKLPTPNQTILTMFKNLDKFIKNGDFVSIDQEIELLNKIVSNKEKQTLEQKLNQISSQACDEVNELYIIFQLKQNHSVNILNIQEKLKINLINVSQIQKILIKFNNNLFQNLQMSLTQFLKDFNQKHIIYQKQQIFQLINNLQFNQMEQQYNQLQFIVSYLTKFQFIFDQNEWKVSIESEMESIYNDIIKLLLSLYNKSDLKYLLQLKKSLIEAEKCHSDFQNTIKQLIDKTQTKISQLFEDYEKTINEKIEKQDSNFQIELNALEYFIQNEEKTDALVQNNYQNRVYKIEEQIAEYKNSMFFDVQNILENEKIELAISQLDQLKYNDIQSFNKFLQKIQNMVEEKINLIKEQIPQIQIQNYEKELKLVLNYMKIIDKFQKGGKYQNYQLLNQLESHMFNKPQNLFEEFNQILNSRENCFTKQTLENLFKYWHFYNIFEQFTGQTEQFQDQKSTLSGILVKLIQDLNTLQIAQQNFIQNPSVNNDQSICWKRYEALLQLLNNKKLFQKYQELSSIQKIGKKILSYSSIMEAQALEKLKTDSIYDSQMNELVNSISKADQYLSNIQAYPFKPQMKSIIQELNIKLNQEIKVIKALCETENIEKISEKLIDLQRISENVSKFVKEVDKKLFEAVELVKQKLGEDNICLLGSRLKEVASGALIVNKISSFQSYRTEKFNELVGQHNIDYILDELRQSSDISDQQNILNSNQKQELKKYYLIYQKQYEKLINEYKFQKQNWGKLIEEVKQFSNINNNQIQSEKEKVIKMLAFICAYWSLTESGEQNNEKKNIFKKPHHAQIISIIILLDIHKEVGFWQGLKNLITPSNQLELENKLIEILTGEGKSLTLGFCSLMLALLGCEVDVVCYSSYLSQRDHNAFKSLFDRFEVSNKINYYDFKQLSENYLKKYSNVRNLTSKLIKAELQLENKENGNQQNQNNKILLIDEVDIFFNLDYYGKTYNPISNLEIPESKQLIKTIWSLRGKNEDRIKKVIKSKDENYQKLIQKYPKFQKLFERHVDQLIQHVNQVENHKNATNYVINKGQIGYRSKDSSINFSTIQGYYTLFAYFYENSLQNNNDKLFDSEKINDQQLESQIMFNVACGNISYALLPQSYTAILGVTGTLYSLNKQMKMSLLNYKISSQFYIPSMFGKTKLKFKEVDDTIIEKDKDNYFLQIQQISNQAIENKQSVLIFFKDEKHLNEYYKSGKLCQCQENYIKVTDHDDSDDYNFKIQRVTRSGQIGLFVREYGRGTDFISLDPIVNKAGGVVVIQTFISDNKTEEIQIRGRSARQGQQGQYYLILNEQNLIEDLKLNSSQIDMWQNDQKSITLYKNLDKKRNELEDNKYQNIDQSIKKATEQHNLSIKYYENIINGNYEEAISYINDYA
ncbi:hypothetical protein ABPG74_010362 [Tetrahymena malaccensis]